MHLGAHWGLWALAVVALVAGVFFILRSRRNKKWNWAAAGVLALIVAVSMFARGWIVWPRQTAEHFISVVYDGSNDDVLEMLSEPSQWKVAADGGLTILAEDSTKGTLSPDTLPLMAASAEEGGVPIPGQVIGEVLAGKLDFTIGTGKKRKCIVHCTAERGSVRIRHVELNGE